MENKAANFKYVEQILKKTNDKYHFLDKKNYDNSIMLADFIDIRLIDDTFKKRYFIWVNDVLEILKKQGDVKNLNYIVFITLLYGTVAVSTLDLNFYDSYNPQDIKGYTIEEIILISMVINKIGADNVIANKATLLSLNKQRINEKTRLIDKNDNEKSYDAIQRLMASLGVTSTEEVKDENKRL